MLISHRATLVLERFLGYRPAVGEVFRVPAYDPSILGLQHLGDLAILPEQISLFVHQPTQRRFASTEALLEYGRRYKHHHQARRLDRRRVPDRVYDPIPEQEERERQDSPALPPAIRAVTTERAEAHPKTSAPNKPEEKSGKPPLYPDKEYFERAYRRVYKDKTDLEGVHASKVIVASNMPTPISERTFSRYLKKWDLPYPPRDL